MECGDRVVERKEGVAEVVVVVVVLVVAVEVEVAVEEGGGDAEPRQVIHSAGPVSEKSKLTREETLESAMTRGLSGRRDLRMWECLVASWMKEFISEVGMEVVGKNADVKLRRSDVKDGVMRDSGRF